MHTKHFMKNIAQTLVFLILLSLSCTKDKTPLTYKDRIAAFVKHSDSDTLIVKHVTDFDWDRMYVFSPYSPPQKVNQALGFQWGDYKETEFTRKEHAVLFVFVHNNKVIDWSISSRTKSDYLPSATIYAYTPETAVFKKYKNEMHPLFKEDKLLKIPTLFQYPPEPGTYLKNGWKYELNILLRKKKGEKRSSKLFYNDIELTGKNGDTISCPLGKFMYFESRSYLAFHGWHNQYKRNAQILDANGFFIKEIIEEAQHF